MAKAARRTNLGSSPELQLLIKLVAVAGPSMAHAAEALIAADFCFETAAHLLITWDCSSCGWSAAMGMVQGVDQANPRCPQCRRKLKEGHVESASLRQRVHRLQIRMRDILGNGFTIDKRRRGVVRFGADAEAGAYQFAGQKDESLEALIEEQELDACEPEKVEEMA